MLDVFFWDTQAVLAENCLVTRSWGCIWLALVIMGMKSNCRAPVSMNTTTTSAKLILLLLLRLFLHFNGHFPDGYGLARSDSSPMSPRHSLLVCTQYLMNCCHPTSGVASRQRLRSSSRHHLIYHDIVAACSAVGRSPSLVRWPGMCCLTTSETRRSVPTISGRG